MSKKAKFWAKVLCWILAGLMVSSAIATLISFLLQ